MSNTRPLFKWELFQDVGYGDFSIISQNKRNASVPEGRATKKDEPSRVFLVYPFHRRWLDNHTSKTSEIVNIVNAVIGFFRGARTSALGSVLSLIKKQGAGLLFGFPAQNVL